MSSRIDETHDASLRSWLPSANQSGCDFPVQNLPFGIFKRRDERQAQHVGVAIGDRILDLAACREGGLLTGEAARAAEVCSDRSLNRLMALRREALSQLRRQVSQLLLKGTNRIQRHPQWETHLLPAAGDAELFLPVEVGDYTDFYSSLYHATNVGQIFKLNPPLMPNYKYVPIGYHGRASSIVVSGTEVQRPSGQIKKDGMDAPAFGPSSALDYEMEMGLYVGTGNASGEPVELPLAETHLFGVCLLNDWSARDVQLWEIQPLGPFLSKSFATSVSPWVVTLDALEPYRAPAFQRSNDDPAPLPYLDHGSLSHRAALDITVELSLSTQRMRESHSPPARLSVGQFRDLYWTPGQLLAHHTSNGCNLRPGDLMGSGTISGPTRENEGCLLELTRGGKEPLTLPGGETRRFLADGDEVILKGYCAAEGFVRIGLGECRGRVIPSRS